MRKIISQVQKQYKGTPEFAAMRTGEIFPTYTVPVIVPAGTDRIHAMPMKWGFPSPFDSGVIINARSETVDTKTMFRGSIARKRCVVPSTGYYEWKKAPGAKKGGQKYHISMSETPMLYMCGIWNDFKNEDGTLFSSFVIITRPAQGIIASIHERMPAVITKSQITSWLYNKEYHGFFDTVPGELIAKNA